MSLRTTVAVPFRQHGSERLGESQFVVALSLDRDWFSPDQASRVVDVATARGLLTHDGNELVVEFDPTEIEVPEGFLPDESILQERSVFEQVLDELVAGGTDKQEAVAAINRLQRDLAITLDVAAILYARRRGVDVDGVAAQARTELGGDS